MAPGPELTLLDALDHESRGAPAADCDGGARPAASGRECRDHGLPTVGTGYGFERRVNWHGRARTDRVRSDNMVSGGSKTVLLTGIVIGAVLLGGLVGAGIDFASGNQGWWGVGAMIGLMSAGVADAALLAKSGGRLR